MDMAYLGAPGMADMHAAYLPEEKASGKKW
jgi:hypothetical protein